ncbi:MAG: alpha-ribazole phosphatase family protein [Microscillaceae bacterium]|jgi:alpha-ribazole phosphatase|nr:alpha-ribazole phosphatase family protein [Microscillaceae bacterium]
MQQKFFLIRHTAPAITRGYMYGRTDLPLADTFAQEANEIKALVANHQSIPLYSSPLQRCRLLAESLQGSSLTIDARIQEMHFGDWEMKRWDELAPEVLDYWLKNIATEPTPNGESNAQLVARSVDFWEEFLTYGHEEAGIVTHFGVIQSLLAHLLHIPIEKVFRLDLDYGAVIQITIREQKYYKIKFLR